MHLANKSNKNIGYILPVVHTPYATHYQEFDWDSVQSPP